MKPKVMAAGEFKAKCLAVMDEVRDKRTIVTITKNGEEVAQLVPVKQKRDPIFGFLIGKGTIVGNIEEPLYTDAEYEQFFKEEAAKYSPIESAKK
jgi:prevent-host-death family protein